MPLICENPWMLNSLPLLFLIFLANVSRGFSLRSTFAIEALFALSFIIPLSALNNHEYLISLFDQLTSIYAN
jgi:hypothetical protein